MPSIQEVLNEFARNELEDEGRSRWSDARLLAFYKQAVMRAMSAGQKHRLAFMRKKYEFTLPAGQSFIALPGDYLIPVEPDGMIRLDTRSALTFKSGPEFDRILSTTALRCYTVDGNLIRFRETQNGDTEMVFRYFYDVKPNELTLASQTPWDGKLDLPMMDYVRMRAKSVDEFTLSQDQALLTDMEQKVLTMFSYQEPAKYRSRGWVPNYGLYRRT